MLSDLQKRKMTRLFQFFDSDGDGVWQASDWTQSAQDVAKAFDVNAAGESYAQLDAVYRGQWADILKYADPDHNQQVTPEEWLTYWSHVDESPEMMRKIVTDYSKGFLALMSLVDPAGPQGYYTPERWGKFLLSHRFSEDDGKAAIRLIDRDGDGKVNEAEWLQAWMEFFGDKPNAPGNSLFGPY